jgi:hypothetical protein
MSEKATPDITTILDCLTPVIAAVRSALKCLCPCCCGENEPWVPPYDDGSLPSAPFSALAGIRAEIAARVPASEGFMNFCRTVDEQHCLMLTISDVSSLQEVVRVIHDHNKSVSPAQRVLLRVAAGTNNPPADGTMVSPAETGLNIPYADYAYSFSLTPCVLGHVVLRLVGPKFEFVEAKGDGVVEVGPHLAVGDLEERLWALKPPLMLPSSPLIPYVTLVGLMANAGHGTGRDTGAMAGMLESLTLVLSNGELYEANAQSEPVHWPAIRGAHFGAFGIIVSATLRLPPARKMRQSKTPVPYFELLHAVTEQDWFWQHEYATAMYMPTYQDDEFEENGPSNVLLIAGQLVPLASEDVDANEWARRFGVYAISAGIGFVDALTLPFVMARHSELIPLLMEVQSLAEVRTQAATEQVGPFWRLSHFVLAFPWALDDIDVVIPVPDDAGERKKLLKRVLQRLRDELVKQRNDPDPFKRHPIIDAVYLRFIKGTPGGLSTSQINPKQDEPGSHHFLCLDVVSNIRVGGYPEFKARLESFLIQEMHGKPHWGKSIPAGTNFQEMYGQGRTDFVSAVEAFAGRAGYSSWQQSPLINPFVAAVMSDAPSAAAAGGSAGAKDKKYSGMSGAVADLEAARLRDALAAHLQNWQLGDRQGPVAVAVDSTSRADVKLMSAASADAAPAALTAQQVAPHDKVIEAARHSVYYHRHRRHALHLTHAAQPQVATLALPADGTVAGATGKEEVSKPPTTQEGLLALPAEERPFHEMQSALQALLDGLRAKQLPPSLPRAPLPMT